MTAAALDHRRPLSAWMFCQNDVNRRDSHRCDVVLRVLRPSLDLNGDSPPDTLNFK